MAGVGHENGPSRLRGGAANALAKSQRHGVPVNATVPVGPGDRLRQHQSLGDLVPTVEAEVVIINDPQRRLRHRLEDLLGIEALDDARRHILQQVFPPLQQDLTVAGHVHELDDRGSRQHAGDQGHGIADGSGSGPRLRSDEEVIGDQGEGRGCRNGRAATQTPGDRPREQDKDQEKRIEARKAHGPCGHAQCGGHGSNRRQRDGVRNESANHVVITIRN